MTEWKHNPEMPFVTRLKELACMMRNISEAVNKRLERKRAALKEIQELGTALAKNESERLSS